MTEVLVTLGVVAIAVFVAWRWGKLSSTSKHQQDVVDAGAKANEVDKKIDSMSDSDKRDRLRKHK